MLPNNSSASGWVCPGCGTWLKPGDNHTCWGQGWTIPPQDAASMANVLVLLSKLDQVIILLEAIYKLMEKPSDVAKG
jgi:hypothetical protein